MESDDEGREIEVTEGRSATSVLPKSTTISTHVEKGARSAGRGQQIDVRSELQGHQSSGTTSGARCSGQGLDFQVS